MLLETLAVTKPSLEDAPMIRLADLLKVSGIAGSGGGAKALVQEGAVKVNGEVETRRGRKLHAGDRVSVAGQSIVVDDEVLRREPKSPSA
jgi:ribosome-associated protein